MICKDKCIGQDLKRSVQILKQDNATILECFLQGPMTAKSYSSVWDAHIVMLVVDDASLPIGGTKISIYGKHAALCLLVSSSYQTERHADSLLYCRLAKAWTLFTSLWQRRSPVLPGLRVPWAVPWLPSSWHCSPPQKLPPQRLPQPCRP